MPDSLEDRPDWVQFTLAPSASLRPDRPRHSLRRLGVRLALSTAAAGAIVITTLPGGPSLRLRHAAVARDVGVFRYPLGCLGASVAPGGTATRQPPIPDPCFHYGVYVTAVLQRSGDIWRLGLKAISPACPAVPLPQAVRAELVACERPPRILTGF